MSGGEFYEQFIEDYFAEAEEHLGTVRRELLELDDTPHERPDAASLAPLSRALHTLKGLSGMVALAAAEQVAHAMEDAVRELPRTSEPHRADLLQSLFTGAQLLENCVAARRANGEPPDVTSYVTDMADAVAASDPSAGGASRHKAVVVSTRVGAGDGSEHYFEFRPSAAAAGRGIGVEQVRQRLMSIGEIVRAAPRVEPGGTLVFEFSVAVRPDAEPPEAWRTDGLTWDEFETVEDEPREQRSRPRQAATASVVRVELGRLDDVMRLIGELVVTRARLDQTLTNAESGRTVTTLDDVRDASDLLDHQLRTLREGIMRIRLVPVGEVFERMRFTTRDISRETGKFIRVIVHGQDTEIDKVVVDRMLEPLLHLVRNSASHGIEHPDDRVAAGKPAEGSITLRARAAGDRIILTIEDDGAGIDVAGVRARAAELGMPLPEGETDMEAVLDIICTPGFSTRESADLTSGRGVGMAVVRSTVRTLGGELFLESTRGRGARFTVELPLTLMIADALLVEVGDQPMAIPQLALREILVLEPDSVTRLENNEVMSYRGGVLPLVELRRLFRHQGPPAKQQHVLVVGGDTSMTGLVVDRLIGLREIVIHPVADPLVAVPGVAGATELADGRVSLILDAAALARRRDHSSARRVEAGGVN